jgi:hypothetical protein
MSVARQARNHLHRPAVGILEQRHRPYEVVADGAERTEVGQRHLVGRPHQPGGQAVAEPRVPRQRPGLQVPVEPRTDDHVGRAADDWRDQANDLLRPVAVIGVEKHHDVRLSDVVEATATGTAVAALSFDDHRGPGGRRHLGSAIARAAIDDDDFGHDLARQIAEHQPDRCRLVERRDDDRNAGVHHHGARG